MKLKSFVIGVLFLFSACLFCVNAKVIKGKPFHSNILNQEINYTVYLPENYDNTKEKYPEQEIPKQIDKLKLQKEYKPFVDEFIQKIISELGKKLHSIYICGSIPKGIALLNRSDADFTLIFTAKPTENELRSIEKIKILLLHKYSFIIKIDTICCTIDEILSQPFDMGFWIKIISFCIYGEDLSNKLPKMLSSVELIKGLNSDTYIVLDRITKRLLNKNKPEDYFRDWKKLSRRLIRALATLIIVKEQSWSDNLQINKDALIRNFPEKEDLITSLFYYYNNPDEKLDNFLELADKVRTFFKSEFSRLTGTFL